MLDTPSLWKRFTGIWALHRPWQATVELALCLSMLTPVGCAWINEIRATPVPPTLVPTPTPTVYERYEFKVPIRRAPPSTQIVDQSTLSSEYSIEQFFDEETRGFLRAGRAGLSNDDYFTEYQGIVTDLSGTGAEDIVLILKRALNPEWRAGYGGWPWDDCQLEYRIEVYRESSQGYVRTEGWEDPRSPRYTLVDKADPSIYCGNLTWHIQSADVALENDGDPFWLIVFTSYSSFDGPPITTHFLAITSSDGRAIIFGAMALDTYAEAGLAQLDTDNEIEITIHSSDSSEELQGRRIGSDNHSGRLHIVQQKFPQEYPTGNPSQRLVFERNDALSIQQLRVISELGGITRRRGSEDAAAWLRSDPILAANALALVGGDSFTDYVQEHQTQFGLEIAHLASDITRDQLVQATAAASTGNLGGAAGSLAAAFVTEHLASVAVQTLSRDSSSSGGAVQQYSGQINLGGNLVDQNLLTESERAWNVMTVDRIREVHRLQEERARDAR